MKKLLLLLSLAFATAAFAQNSGGGEITKSTSGATKNDLDEDFNINTGRVVDVKGGTLRRTGSGVVTLNATLAAVSVTNGAALDALAGVGTSGGLYRTGANTYAARTITGTANQITVTNGDGVAGAPTISLPTSVAGINSITAAASNPLTLSGGTGAAYILVSGSTAATGLGTGVFQTSGGISISENSYFGNSVTITNGSTGGLLKLTRDNGANRGLIQMGRENSGTIQITGQIKSAADTNLATNGVLTLSHSDSAGSLLDVATFSGAALSSGKLAVLYSTASVSPSTGAFTVAGGAGITGDAWIGGNVKIADSRAFGWASDTTFIRSSANNTTLNARLTLTGTAVTSDNLTVTDAGGTAIGGGYRLVNGSNTNEWRWGFRDTGGTLGSSLSFAGFNGTVWVQNLKLNVDGTVALAGTLTSSSPISSNYASNTNRVFYATGTGYTNYVAALSQNNAAGTDDMAIAQTGASYTGGLASVGNNNTYWYAPSKIVVARGSGATQAFSFDGSVFTVLSTTTSATTGSGALVVAGGAGFGADVNGTGFIADIGTATEVRLGTVTGSGPVISGNATGQLVFNADQHRFFDKASSNEWLNISLANGAAFTPKPRASGVASYFTVSSPADSGLTANTESIGAYFNLGATRTWADGTVATQREFVISAPTYNKTTTSATFTNAFTFYVSGAPNAGSGVTITNSYAGYFGGSLWVNGNLVGVSNVSASGSILSSSATNGVGYATGAGGAVTQATSRTTGVTLNKIAGDITLVSAAGSTSWQSFTVTNSTVAAKDNVKVDQATGTDKYMIHVTAVAAGSFVVTYATTGGTTTEQPVFHFSVIKSVSS